jgi:hypothetical protein
LIELLDRVILFIPLLGENRMIKSHIPEMVVAFDPLDESLDHAVVVYSEEAIFVRSLLVLNRVVEE